MNDITPKEHEALVRAAIAAAQAVAPNDDKAFVHALRESFFLGQRKRTGRLRVLPKAKSPQGDVSVHIYDDPRFLKNARALAEKTRSRIRIMGGSAVRGTQFQDCVAVGSDAQWACTGTLIAPTVVLTAGHCAEVATRVFVGNDVAKKGRQVRVKKRIRHPRYHRAGKHNDLLILVLDAAVEGVPPRHLAPSPLIDQAGDGRVVGFGTVDLNGSYGYGIKRQTDVPVASPLCSGNREGQEDRVVYGCDVGLEIVAGKPLFGKDTCSGDSGGPFYVANAQGKWFLGGATSRATDSATYTCGDGGVYARVDKYRAWIESATGLSLP